MSWKKIIKKLKKPFEAEELRMLVLSREKNRGIPAPKEEALIERLDQVLGRGEWEESYTQLKTKTGYSFKCTLTIKGNVREAVGCADLQQTASFFAFYLAARKWGLCAQLSVEPQEVALKNDGSVKKEKELIKTILDSDQESEEKTQYANILLLPVTHLSKAGLYLKYFGKRFPLFLSLLLACGFFLPGYFLAGRLLPQAASLPYPLLFAGIGLILLFMLHLRIFDEHKDFVADQRAHPNRILSRGLITLSGLRKILSVVLWLELTLAFVLPLSLFFTWAFLFLYSLLMLKEFFLPRFLGRHITLYMLSHQKIIFFFVLFAMLSRIPFIQNGALIDSPDAFYAYLLYSLGFFLVYFYSRLSYKFAQTFKLFAGKPFLKRRLASQALFRTLLLALGLGLLFCPGTNPFTLTLPFWIVLLFLLLSVMQMLLSVRTPAPGNFKVLALFSRLFFWTALATQMGLIFSGLLKQSLLERIAAFFEGVPVTLNLFAPRSLLLLLLFALGMILLTMAFEVARKTRSADMEKPSGSSYTKALGVKGAVGLGQFLGFGAFALFGFFLGLINSAPVYRILLAFFYLLFFLQGMGFLRTPIRGNAKGLSAFAMLYLLGTFLLSALAFG